jgi:phytoene synthase
VSRRPSSALGEAYAHCEAVTRTQAANFYYGIRLLAAERRRAMCAVYAFARRIDDIGDGSLPEKEKRARLQREAGCLQAIEAGAAAPAEDPVMLALADAYARFQLPHGALGELIEGVRMDVDETRYESFEQLVPYCRRVAGAIGRVCLAIFKRRGEAAEDRAGAEALADDLGVALQLTNILRDLREDAENGRVYLPSEDLERFGILDGARGGAHEDGAAPALLAALQADGDRVSELVRFEAERARAWFERGIVLAALLDRRSAACLLAMAGIYRRLLERIDARPQEVARRRVSLPAHEKAWVAARGMLGVSG